MEATLKYKSGLANSGNINAISKLEQIKEDQLLGHHIKCVKEIYLFLFSKKSPVYIENFTVRWKLFRCYLFSINKVIKSQLITRTDAGIKRLLEAADHTLVRWTTVIQNYTSRVSHRHFELYFQAILQTALNKSLYNYRKGLIDESHKMLESVEEIYITLSLSFNPTSRNLCGEYLGFKGGLWLDSGQFYPAFCLLLESLKTYSGEKFQDYTVKELTEKQIYKISVHLQNLISVTYTLGMNHFLNNNKNEAINSFRMCKWICQYSKKQFRIRKSNSFFLFIEETIKKDEDIFEAEMKIRNNDIVTKTPIKKPQTFSTSDMNTHIDLLWKDSASKAYGDILLAEEEKAKRIKMGWAPILTRIRGKKSVDVIPESEAHYPEPRRKSIEPRNLEKNRQKKTTTTIQAQEILTNPDVYFKEKICSDLNIDLQWLEETNRRKRFKQDVIQKIKNSEQTSVKATKILKNFLMTKRRDQMKNNIISNISLKKEVSLDVGYKALKIKNEFLNSSKQFKNKRKFVNTLHYPAQPSSDYSPNQPYSKFRSRTPIKFGEEKKLLANTAYNLQKEIEKLEGTVSSASKSSLLKSRTPIRRARTALKPRKHQNLAESILKREQVREARSTQKRIVSSNSFLL